VSLNHAITQTLLALGVTTFGTASRKSYSQIVVEPELPPTVFDIGTIEEPNLELLAEVRPKAILYSSLWTLHPLVLKKIAPTVDIPLFIDGRNALSLVTDMLNVIAEMVDAQPMAESYANQVQECFAQTRDRLRKLKARTVLGLFSPGPRAMWGYVPGSLFDGVITELGLHNAITAWDGGAWGWAPIPLQQLATMDDVWAISLGPLPSQIHKTPLWDAIPFVRQRRVITLPSIYMWGGLPSAERLARTLGHALAAHV
jgi:iron complex transport system substrate-binding protein